MKKNIIITGANGALGIRTTRHLIDEGFHVIMACRNLKKAGQDIKQFKKLNDSSAYTLLYLDLSDFQSIVNVEKVLDGKEVYGLICNAGMSYDGPIRYSKQGVEETFCSNYLGHFLLTQLLLKTTAVRKVLFISSALHDPAVKSPFPSAVFKPVQEMAYPNPEKLTEKSFSEFYATAKLCEILFAYELNRRLNSAGQLFNINAFNPGFMPLTNFGRTKNNLSESLFRYSIHLIGRLIGFGTTAEISGKQAAKILTESNESGKYFDQDKAIPSSQDSYDEEKAILLWDGSYELVSEYLKDKI